MANAKKKCVNCKQYFKDGTGFFTNIGFFHSKNCQLDKRKKETDKLIKKAKNKKLAEIEKKPTNKRQSRVNDLSFRLEATQTSFNRYIRKRDEFDDCISCYRAAAEVFKNDGWKFGGAWDCGHFLTVGAYPELRFEELNAHKQCKSCNAGHGHSINNTYRIKLIDKIGLSDFAQLNNPRSANHYSCAELKIIEKTYKRKFEELALIF